MFIRIDERGERIPLTIADWDKEEGSVTIVVMEVLQTLPTWLLDCVSVVKVVDEHINLIRPKIIV